MWRVKVDDEVGIENIETDWEEYGNIHLHLFGSMLTVRGNFNELHNLSIYNMNGIKMLPVSNVQSDYGIYVGNLKAGVYFVQISTDKGTYRTKVLKR